MSRKLRELALALLPAGALGFLRRCYHRFKTRPIEAPVTFLENQGRITAKVGDQIALQILPEVRADLKTHLTAAEHAMEMKAFLAQAKHPGTLFDIGAHNGFFSLLYCLSHPSNRAVAYEPSPQLHQRLKTMVSLNGLGDRITAEEKALGDTEHQAQLFLDPQGGFVQAADYPGTARQALEKVVLQTATLDAECARLGRSPTLIKMDIEGYEWEALRGAARLLATVKPLIFLELHLNYLEYRGLSPRAVTQLLTSHGYAFFSLNGRPLSSDRICNSWSPVLRLVASANGAPGGEAAVRSSH